MGVRLSFKNEVSKELTEELRDFCKAEINSVVAGAYDGGLLAESIGFSLESNKKTLYLGVWADINSELF